MRGNVDDRLFVEAVKGVFAMSYSEALRAVDVVAEEVEEHWPRLSFDARRSIRRAIEENGPSFDRWGRCVEVCDSTLMNDEIEEGVNWWR